MPQPSIIPLTDEELATVTAEDMPKLTSEERRRLNRVRAQAQVSADPSPLSRFAGGVWDQVSGIPSGIAQAVRHPIDTINASRAASTDLRGQANTAWNEGRYLDSMAYKANAAVPFMGPAVNAAAEKMSGGNVAGALGDAAGLGLVPHVMDAVGAGASRARNVATERMPERMYGRVFKPTAEDIAAKYNAKARGETNPTLPREVMERGVTGGIEDMAVRSRHELTGFEDQLQAIAGEKTVTLPQKKAYVSLLNEIRSSFKDTLFSERAKEANDLVAALRGPGDAVPARVALKVKRFLDDMRNTSSFRENPRLSMQQEEFKVGADRVRSALKKDPEMADLLNEERLRIEMFDSLVKAGVRQANSKLLSLTDSLLGGGGFVTGHPVEAAAAGAALHMARQPAAITTVAQGLYKTGQRLPHGIARPVARALSGPAMTKSNEP